MKNSKFSEVQIIKILSEQNQGKTVNEICRDYGISQPTFYNWKSKYGGLDVQQLSKMKELEKELSQYKKIVAELTLENVVMKDVIAKKF
ncbi:transposase [Chryseobacterium sp. MEBOG06]|uniref:transposase n=1 Tax=unclassified Chryseobacterium TaxID=2593645 RepID=UPI001F025EE8|nr:MULTISPECIES: transposase [unclassified Chryseobacterium]UKB82443.1 transposase [Chryseobacterium sp. MEBOG06]UKB84857.1 transposase [Chryseobacterium sp. MEBOG06]UKB84877.1 transposase [Chryseobacterium sp. MEBOG06]